ncbi:hypothetical protein SXIM_27310 [Streptomyces xiamenensis]|uniref:Uncharacterized protein n=1 Tax=Streptomyces xiamenensis TaxID=408015 RepID=A0A0F7FVZ1_9ACTN|nr:hypothetical protein SXIM_27310 [Streptomyces xiamenensis]
MRVRVPAAPTRNPPGSMRIPSGFLRRDTPWGYTGDRGRDTSLGYIHP